MRANLKVYRTSFGTRDIAAHRRRARRGRRGELLIALLLELLRPKARRNARRRPLAPALSQ